MQKANSVLETPNILPLGQIQTSKVFVMIFEKMRNSPLWQKYELHGTTAVQNHSMPKWSQIFSWDFQAES